MQCAPEGPLNTFLTVGRRCRTELQAAAFISAMWPGFQSARPGRRCRAEAGAGSQVEQCLGRKVEAALLEVGVRRLTVQFLVDWSFLGFLRALFADNLLLSFLLHGLYMTESSD